MNRQQHDECAKVFWGLYQQALTLGDIAGAAVYGARYDYHSTMTPKKPSKLLLAASEQKAQECQAMNLRGWPDRYVVRENLQYRFKRMLKTE